MARIALRQLLDHAAEHGYGVPAFNINNMEQVIAIMAAARQADAPVILQASRGARAYAGDAMIRKMVEAAEETCPAPPSIKIRSAEFFLYLLRTTSLIIA